MKIISVSCNNYTYNNALPLEAYSCKAQYLMSRVIKKNIK